MKTSIVLQIVQCTIYLSLNSYCSKKTINFSLNYKTEWPKGPYTGMFSSSGAMMDNNISLLSSILKYSSINQTFNSTTPCTTKSSTGGKHFNHY